MLKDRYGSRATFYAIDGRLFAGNWFGKIKAVEYLVKQGFGYEEAGEYLKILMDESNQRLLKEGSV